MTWHDEKDSHRGQSLGRFDQFLATLDSGLINIKDIQALFSEFTTRLQEFFTISKGFLAIKDGRDTRFLAVSALSKNNHKRKLSLRLPKVSSLFNQVIDDGRIYTENFATLFEGNVIERQLLINDLTKSFVLKPLKSDGHIIGLLGYSSEYPETFATFEEGLFDPVIDRFAELVLEAIRLDIEKRL